MLKKEFSNALENYLKCLSLDRMNITILKRLTKLYLSLNPIEFSNALSYLDQALKLVEEKDKESEIVILISKYIKLIKSNCNDLQNL